jgi:outer membrane protein assembly factor BamB
MKRPLQHRRAIRFVTCVAGMVGMVASLIAAAPTLSSASAAAPGPGRPLEFDAPSGLAFGGGHLWVTNLAGDSVTEIDPSTRRWVKTFEGGRYGFNRPTAIASTGSDLFVANQAGSVTEMQARTGAPIRSIAGPSFGFTEPIGIAISGDTVLVLNAGRPSATPAVPGSISEVDALTGRLIRRVSGKSFGLDDPVALTTAGPDVFVADKGSNSVTEVRVATGRLVRVVANEGLSAPDGIAVAEGHVWVADSKTDATTEIDASTGEVVANLGDEDANYGFGAPSVAIESAGNVFIASPFGTSPMVTKLSAANGAPSWYMCNTNGPYYFSLLSAFAVSGDELWVASRSGANSKTPAAKTGSLTELQTGSGALVATLPAPN